MSPFKTRVLEIIRMIPKGKVASYSQIAAYAGLPRAAREVGWILNGIEGAEDVPWWRVVNMKGYLSIRGNQTADKELQKKLLESEGIEVGEDFTLEIKKYQLVLSENELSKLQLEGEYLRNLLLKYSK